MHIVGETGNTEVAELLIHYGALTDLQNEVCTTTHAGISHKTFIGVHEMHGQMYPN